jgi:hypothetical protein
MYSRTLKRRVTNFEGAQKDASGRRRGPKAAFRQDLRADFRWPEMEVPRNEGDDRRRGIGVERGEDRISGGSDPTLSGMGAAQRLRRRGSLPPELSSRFPRSVAGRVASGEGNDSESRIAEEMKRWL